MANEHLRWNRGSSYNIHRNEQVVLHRRDHFSLMSELTSLDDVSDCSAPALHIGDMIILWRYMYKTSGNTPDI